jgi:hypothetical protein
MPPFNHNPAPYTGPSKEEVIALRKKFLSPGEQHWQVLTVYTCSAAAHKLSTHAMLMY